MQNAEVSNVTAGGKSICGNLLASNGYTLENDIRLSDIPERTSYPTKTLHLHNKDKLVNAV